ncbi:nuclear transport factor 2 family protein [uncultured Tenacibaculum sp.]|uniref:nuclear transport factor 2 family protein n=1 Tax=uncultured Tenacibaculum sp. TaxID=174713 RepID=UPI00262AE13A|nr:nuclear transport factor 2 family protein [uncultured Tenacibaculum sp.]
MKTKILIFLTTLILLSCTTNAQKDDKKGVKSTLTSYINAGDTNNVVQLNPQLHPNFRVALYDHKKNAISILDKATYVSFIESKKFGGYKRKASFENFQFIEKNMATVKVTLTSPGKPTLKNFYSLVKIKNKWLIIQDYVMLIP